jgi:uncharacterized RDD family membrane protein YckC
MPQAYARFSRRFLGLVLDGTLLGISAAILVIGAAAGGSDATVRTALAIVIFAAIIYDPVLVSTTGGTVGHHILNLRVVDDQSGANLSFLRALLRAVIKSFLGIASFIFMGVTRRHQALHDLASRSTVQIRDISKAEESHFVTEQEISEPVGASRARRVVVIVGFVIAGSVFMMTAGVLMLSDNCSLRNICSPGEDLLFNVLYFGWIGFSALVIISGWRGRLLGCRGARPPA